MRKVTCISLVVLVALLTTTLMWAQAQRGQAPAVAGQAQGGQRGPAYVGKAMPGNMPGSFTVIRGSDLQTIVAQTGGDTPARVVDSPSGNYGAYVLTYQPTAPQPERPINGTYHSEVA